MQPTRTMMAGVIACLAVLGFTRPGAAQTPNDLRTCRGHVETGTAETVEDLNTWTEDELLLYFPTVPPGELGLFIGDSDGDDVIVGTSRNDIILLSTGNDIVCAGHGHDAVAGFSEVQHSAVFLGEGDDVALRQNAARIHGGPGRDLIVANGATEQPRIVIRGGRGADDIFFLGDNGVIRGGPGADRIRTAVTTDVRAYGGPGGDLLDANEGTIVFRGGPGNDIISGPDEDEFFGPSQIRGGGGDDYLVGRSEDDTIRGGPGTDTCAFSFDRGLNPDLPGNAVCEQEAFIFGGDRPEFTAPQSWWSTG